MGKCNKCGIKMLITASLLGAYLGYWSWIRLNDAMATQSAPWKAADQVLWDSATNDCDANSPKTKC